MAEGRRRILQMISQWIENTPEERNAMVWPAFRGAEGSWYPISMDPGDREHMSDRLLDLRDVGEAVQVGGETYHITEQLYDRIFPNDGGADDATIRRDELYGSPYRLSETSQEGLASAASSRPSRRRAFGEIGYHWELSVEPLTEMRQMPSEVSITGVAEWSRTTVSPRMFGEPQGLKYSDDYKQEINRLYNLDQNDQPFEPPLTREQRMCNPSDFYLEGRRSRWAAELRAIVTRRVTNEARRLQYWEVEKYFHEDDETRLLTEAAVEMRTLVEAERERRTEEERGARRATQRQPAAQRQRYVPTPPPPGYKGITEAEMTEANNNMRRANSTPITDDKEKLTEKRRLSLCPICLDRKADCVFSPCGHLVTCMICAGHKSMTKCPICRSEITGATQIIGGGSRSAKKIKKTNRRKVTKNKIINRRKKTNRRRKTNRRKKVTKKVTKKKIINRRKKTKRRRK